MGVPNHYIVDVKGPRKFFEAIEEGTLWRLRSANRLFLGVFSVDKFGRTGGDDRNRLSPCYIGKDIATVRWGNGRSCISVVLRLTLIAERISKLLQAAVGFERAL